MTKKIFMLPVLWAFLWLSSVSAATESQLAVISTLGELNGIALQCRYTEQMQRIKQQLVLLLPKQRALGEWFELSTHDSFMQFMNKNSSCPGSQDFIQQVDLAISKLGSEFKK